MADSDRRRNVSRMYLKHTFSDTIMIWEVIEDKGLYLIKDNRKIPFGWNTYINIITKDQSLMEGTWEVLTDEEYFIECI